MVRLLKSVAPAFGVRWLQHRFRLRIAAGFDVRAVHDRFIDAIHFDPGGEQQMAETMFAGLKAILERELSPPAAGGP